MDDKTRPLGDEHSDPLPACTMDRLLALQRARTRASASGLLHLLRYRCAAVDVSSAGDPPQTSAVRDAYGTGCCQHGLRDFGDSLLLLAQLLGNDLRHPCEQDIHQRIQLPVL